MSAIHFIFHHHHLLHHLLHCHHKHHPCIPALAVDLSLPLSLCLLHQSISYHEVHLPLFAALPSLALVAAQGLPVSCHFLSSSALIYCTSPFPLMSCPSCHSCYRTVLPSLHLSLPLSPPQSIQTPPAVVVCEPIGMLIRLPASSILLSPLFSLPFPLFSEDDLD